MYVCMYGYLYMYICIYIDTPSCYHRELLMHDVSCISAFGGGIFPAHRRRERKGKSAATRHSLNGT